MFLVSHGNGFRVDSSCHGGEWCYATYTEWVQKVVRTLMLHLGEGVNEQACHIWKPLNRIQRVQFNYEDGNNCESSES